MTKKVFVPLLALMLFLQVATTLNAAGLQGKEIAKKAVKLVKKGDKAVKSQKLDKALKFYQDALALEPNYAVAHLQMATLYMMQKKGNEAFTHLNKAYENQKQDPAVSQQLSNILFRVASSFIQQRKVKEATTFYEKLVAIPNIETINKMNYAKARYQLGTNYTMLKEYKKSNDHFTKFLAIPDLGPQFAQYVTFAHYMIGVNYSSLEEFDKSNEYLNKYLELTKANEADPRRPDALYMVASNNYGKLQKETAGIDKEKLDEIAGKAKAHTEIAPLLQKVVDSSARDVIKEQAYMKMGNYYYMCRDIDQAISTYEALIEKFPNSRDLDSFKNFLTKLKDIKTKQEKAKQSKKSTKKKGRK